MDLVRPNATSDSALVSTDVPEAVPAAYSSGTTYANNAIVSVLVSGTVYDVYKSLQSLNTNHAPASSPTWWVKVGRTYKAWDSGTTFSQGDIVNVVGTNYHHQFVSVANSNVNHDPVLDTAGTYWLDMGWNNRWALLDTSVSSQTTNWQTMSYTLSFSAFADTVAVLNTYAKQIRVEMTTVAEGVVFDETFEMLSDDGITDYEPYFFYPAVMKRDLIVVNIPQYLNYTIKVTWTAEGEEVRCGALICGLRSNIGATQYGASIGIRDFSTKEQNDFGDFFVVERAYSKRMNCTVYVYRENTDYVANLLADYRSTPLLFIGSNLYSSTAIFGFLKDWNEEIDLPITPCTMDVEGLT